jgi:hypothetical protein
MQSVIIMIAMITLGGRHMEELKSAAGPAVMEPQLKKRKKKKKQSESSSPSGSF